MAVVQSALPAGVRCEGRRRQVGALDRETQNPVSITNVGWSKAAIKAGDQVTVVLFAVKNGQPLGRVSSVTLPNGKTLLTGEGESKEVHDKLERDARAAQPN